MSNFLSAGDCKKSFFLSLAATMLFFVLLENNVNADGCSLLCGGSWYVHYSSPTPVELKSIISTSVAVNKKRDYPDEPPPMTTCETASGTVDVVSLEISGALTYGICSSSGIHTGKHHGQSIAYNYSACPGIAISDFCQTCKVEMCLRYSVREYEMKCTCGSSAVKSGYVKTFGGHCTNASTGLRPSASRSSVLQILKDFFRRYCLI